jgi:hypothetical protein
MDTPPPPPPELPPSTVARADQGEALVRDTGVRIAQLSAAFMKELIKAGVPPPFLVPLCQQYLAYLCQRFM